MSSKQMNRLFLMIEAVLIVISLATGGKAVIGMICYWSIVAVNNLTDYLIGRSEEDGKGK